MDADLRRANGKKRASEPQFPSTQERRHPLPPKIQPLTQSQLELIGNVSFPLSLSFLLRAIKPWDEGATITVPIEEAPFGIAIDQIIFKDDITQVCKI